MYNHWIANYFYRQIMRQIQKIAGMPGKNKLSYGFDVNKLKVVEGGGFGKEAAQNLSGDGNGQPGKTLPQ